MTPNTNIKEIEFAPSGPIDGPIPGAESNPWATAKRSTFEDMILKPEFADRRLRFPVEKTWFRIVPSFKASAYGWMMGVHAIKWQGGQIVHPRTFRRDRKCAFDVAYSYLKAHCPETLYQKSNKEGFKLLPDPVSVFWAVTDDETGKTISRIFVGSGYDGIRGGAPSLGNRLFQLTQECDENQQLMADPVNPDAGALICVDKTQPPGVRYPSYALRVGNLPAPMSEFIRKMDDEEFAALCPLENALRELSVEEEWLILGKIVGEALADKIQASTR